MDTQTLRAFLAVAEQASFSIAAEHLHLTQSAVSKRIQQLEMQLGTLLFDRHNRTVSLTEAGLALRPRAQHILDLVSDTELQIHNLRGEVGGTLSLATSHHIGLHRLPPILREFVRRYPNAQINLDFLGSERAYQAIQMRHVELALTTLDDHCPEQITATALWHDDMVCVVANSHPLAHQSSITLHDLAACAAILPEPDTITFKLVEQVFRGAGIPLYAPMPTNYLETIKMMVSVGMGWSVLPSNMVDQQLCVLPWPSTQLQRQLGMLHLEHRTLSNAAQAFIALVHEFDPQQDKTNDERVC